MKEFFAKYWTWMAGAFGIIVLIRSYKVATNSAFYNAQTASSTPYAHAGSAGAAGVTSLTPISGADTLTTTINGVTKTTLKRPTETGINAGSENGSAAANYLNRSMAVGLGNNSYPYSDPVTGASETMYIHTMYYLGADYTGAGVSDWFVVFSSDPSSDTLSPLSLGDAGVTYDGNSDVAGSSAYWPAAPNGQKASSFGAGSAGVPAGFSSPYDTGISAN